MTPLRTLILILILGATAAQADGLAVNVGCYDAQELVQLAKSHQLVEGLVSDEAAIPKIQAALRAAGVDLRCTVRPLTGKRLPYADNLVNDLVSTMPIADDEVLRVLAPGGKALVNGRTITKPTTADDWGHFLHGPDNNAVSRCADVNLPRALQWVAGPRWARSHEEFSTVNATVTAGGRLFYIVDQSPLAYISFNPSWKLVARDAYNGLKLWERSLSSWNDHMRQFRSGPAHLPRRLVATGDKVYVTLGLDAPLTELDARTGKTLRTYTGTEWCEEILFVNGTLYLLVGSSETNRHGSGLQFRDEPKMRKDRFLAAIDAATGAELWRRPAGGKDFIMPMGMAYAAGRLFYHSIQGLGCLEATSGKQQWFTKPPTTNARYAFSTSTLVATPKVVILADRNAKTPATTAISWAVGGWTEKGGGARPDRKCRATAYDARTGKELWNAPAAEGYNSPIDVFVIDGRVWLGAFNGGRKQASGLDLLTGTPTKTISTAGAPVGMGHDRCYRNKASVRYIFSCRDGIEVHDLEKGWIRNNSWTRGPCGIGIMPANGLMYAPTDPCACHLTTRMAGYKAYTSQRVIPTGNGTLIKGPAYPMKPTAAEADWPMHRHDIQRSGTTPNKVSPAVRIQWTARLRGKLSQPIAAPGAVYVAVGNRVVALDRATGKTMWSHTTSGRIDSAPTWHRGRLLFGSADGHVYCLDARSGILTWRFRAAPERTVVMYGRLASTWPIHGSVLPIGDEVCFTAGTSSYLGGGILFYRLKIATGAVVKRSVITYIDPKTEAYIGKEEASNDSDGVVSDILSSNGSKLFLKDLSLSLSGEFTESAKMHLFSPTSLLDDDWFVRSYWAYGHTSLGAGYSRWTDTGLAYPSGRVLAFSRDRIYGYGRKTIVAGRAGHKSNSYHLFSMSLKGIKRPTMGKPQFKTIKAKDGTTRKKKKAPKLKIAPKQFLWTQDFPCSVRAMVNTPSALLLAGVPDLGRRAPGKRLAFANPREAQDAFEGRRGANLYFVSKEDGKVLKKIPLPAAPIHDGMAVGSGQIFISLKNGTVVLLDR